MRRWNGWGLEDITYQVPPGAVRFLEKRQKGHILRAAPLPDAALEDIARSVPPSRLPPHPAVKVDPADRVRHALGQSLSDWVRLRSGLIPAFPDGVSYPESADDVRQLLDYASKAGAAVIPYGGGTSVVGHLTVPPGLDRPVLSVDLGRLSALTHFDEVSGLATFGPGVKGPDLEAELRDRGYTLGHFPQSFEFSSLGGWVATRSAGQESLLYGRIEDLFAGGRLESPRGSLVLPPHPASAAGPDLRQLVLGSEGRLGILTGITVRARPRPQAQAGRAVFFPDFASGLAAVRSIAQNGRTALSMLRLSTAEETATTLALAGHARLLGAFEKWLSWRGTGVGKCMLIVGAAGSRAGVRAALREASDACHDHRGVGGGAAFAHEWLKNRFRSPYLRNTLWDMGYAVDTLETAVSWDKVAGVTATLERMLAQGLAAVGEAVHAFAHISHVYRDGANIYVTYLFPQGRSPEESLRRWRVLKEAASKAIVEAGGTISHQHGVGLDHVPYLAAEKGPLGLDVVRAACRELDPEGVMNPGKLV